MTSNRGKYRNFAFERGLGEVYFQKRREYIHVGSCTPSLACNVLKIRLAYPAYGNPETGYRTVDGWLGSKSAKALRGKDAAQ